MPRFPVTKDEKFLLGVAEKSLETSKTLFAWVDWKALAKKLNFGEKCSSNIVQILARTALLQKKEPFLVRLTAVSMRHYGEAICQICKVDFSLTKLPEEEEEDFDDDEYEEE